MLPAVYTESDNLDPVALIWQSDKAQHTKVLYAGLIAKFLETGQQLTDRRALARFAATLTNNRAAIFRAAVTLWSREMIAELKANVTPGTLPQVQAAIMRLEVLTDGIKVKKRRGTKAHTWLSDRQVQALFESCDDGPRGLRDKVLLGLMVNCGLRRSETIAVKWGHIVTQPLGGELCTVLNVIAGKGNRDRAIPLPQAMLVLLDAWAGYTGRDGYVIRAIMGTKIKKKASREVPTYVVKLHGAAIGLPDLAPHDLRRTAAQAWYRASNDIVLVQSLLGHESIETTRGYLQADQTCKIAAVGAVKWGNT